MAINQQIEITLLGGASDIGASATPIDLVAHQLFED
jgi:hypothetical protein